jgi:acyl-CoA dehydrogenase
MQGDAATNRLSPEGTASVREDLRAAVRTVCAQFSGAYWRELDQKAMYPSEFVTALTRDGWLSILIPEEYGGAGLGIGEAAVVLQEINRSGGNSAAAHAQMYIMGTILRHGSDRQRQRFLPRIARGELRLQAFGVTEPDAGSDTTRIRTTAVRRGTNYVLNGLKVFTSRAEHSDLMLVLARTTAYSEVGDKTRGLSVLLVDLPAAIRAGQVTIRPLNMMVTHSTTEVAFHDLEVPAENLVGAEGEGFRHLLDSWNAERILIAAECIGDGDWFVEHAARYSSDRIVFGHPIGANQGVQFPIAQAYAQIRAAEQMTFHAAELFDRLQPCGAEANMAKLLASQASWAAANACMDAYGGYGFATEYDVERKFRETRLYSIAPVSNNLVLAFLGQHVLDMPKSY